MSALAMHSIHQFFEPGYIVLQGLHFFFRPTVKEYPGLFVVYAYLGILYFPKYLRHDFDVSAPTDAREELPCS